MAVEASRQTIELLGESIGFWVQTTAIVVTGATAIWSIRANGKSSRHRATIDLLLAQKTDESLIQAKKVMAALHENDEFTALACKDKNKDPKRASILVILNNYEFIALGIREGALDEKIYKRAYCSMLMRDWEAMKPFVMELRRQNNMPTLFQEFEYLAAKWKKKPLKPNAS